MLQIAVCEDEQTDRDNLIAILKPLLDKHTEEYRITDFTSGGELLQSGGSFHLIFMDIMMEGRSGIETGQELYSRNQSAKIIYTTNYGQYCMDAVNTVHAFAFLAKPVSIQALEEQLLAFLRQYQKEEVRLEFCNVSYEENGVLSEKHTLLLPVDTILYFEYIKSKKKVKIVTENMVYEYPDAISGLEKRMQPCGFATSRRGILVNLKNVAKTKGYDVVLKNGESVPLSQKRVAQFKERLNEYIHSTGE